MIGLQAAAAREWLRKLSIPGLLESSFKGCAKIRLRPEIALTRFQLAELLLERYPDERHEAPGLHWSGC